MYDVHGATCTHDAAPRSPAGITAVCWAGDGAELLCGFEDGHVATHNPSTLAEVKRSANPRTYLANATQLLANGWDYGGDVLKEEQHAPKEQGAAVADVGWLEKDANITFKGADLDIEAPPSPRLMMLCSNGELSMYTLADKMHVASDFQGGYPMMKPKRQPDPIAAVVPSGPAISPEPRFGGLFTAGPVLPPAASVNPVAVPTNPATPFVSFSQTATILAHDPPVDPAGAVAAEKEKQRQKRVDETKAKNAAIKKLKAEISGDWCTAMENQFAGF